MEQEATYVGIDVAKAQVDVAVRPTDERWQVSHDDAGIRQLISKLKTLEPVMVLLEASGGLELPLVAALAAEAVPVVVVNPRQVRDFARATGKLAKTDSLDAAAIAHSSTRAKCGTLPGQRGSWPRPTRLTRRLLLTLPKRSDLPCALCGTPKPRPSTPWLPEGTR